MQSSKDSLFPNLVYAQDIQVQSLSGKKSYSLFCITSSTLLVLTLNLHTGLYQQMMKPGKGQQIETCIGMFFLKQNLWCGSNNKSIVVRNLFSHQTSEYRLISYMIYKVLGTYLKWKQHQVLQSESSFSSLCRHVYKIMFHAYMNK